jgi:mono/diheme cytochrome c family protein
MLTYPDGQLNRDARIHLEVIVENRSRRRIVAILAGLFAWPPGSQSAVADGQLLARGHAIAAQKCSPCHAIGRDDERPHDIVLPFRDFPERYPISMLVEAGESGMISGHDEMPGFDLSETEMRALLSYIDSFAPSGQRYVKP